MSDVNKIKPWFREDLEQVLTSVYFTSVATNPNASDDFRKGVAVALSAVAMVIGIDFRVVLGELRAVLNIENDGA